MSKKRGYVFVIKKKHYKNVCKNTFGFLKKKEMVRKGLVRRIRPKVPFLKWMWKEPYISRLIATTAINGIVNTVMMAATTTISRVLS